MKHLLNLENYEALLRGWCVWGLVEYEWMPWWARSRSNSSEFWIRLHAVRNDELVNALYSGLFEPWCSYFYRYALSFHKTLVQTQGPAIIPNSSNCFLHIRIVMPWWRPVQDFYFPQASFQKIYYDAGLNHDDLSPQLKKDEVELFVCLNRFLLSGRMSNQNWSFESFWT